MKKNRIVIMLSEKLHLLMITSTSIYLVEIVIFSLYHFIIRPTKIIKRDDKNWAHF